eukprot:TRINITY_DN9539_c0_g1_i1.p1 TRINITY_DN9539_c0_g1~~TRINITY_DN9539_c0_g1_i1.p1  ORF type:complete len:271 (-),score=15.46 TRINITY_DN9539_c0_g1_i1:162-974(-)
MPEDEAIPFRCQYCSANNKCTVCHYGHYLDGDDCKPCSQANCVVCTKDACQTCNIRFTLAEDKTCKACDEGCSECTGTECKACRTYHSMGANGKCQKCPDKCKDCSDDPTKCKVCIDGYFLKDGACIACSTLNKGPCAKCTADGCIDCKTFFDTSFYSFSNSQCIKCPDNCESCESATKCIVCRQNSKKNADGTCQKTEISNCLKIEGNDHTKCSECSNGYKVKADGTACETYPCPEGKGPDKDNKCLECMNNCLRCDLVRGVCLLASPG